MSRFITRRSLLTAATASVGVAVLAACTKKANPPASPSSSSTPIPTPKPTPTPTPSFVDPLPAGAVNVLVVGSDSRSNDLNDDARSDVIVVAQLNMARDHINLVSIPRDTLANLPNGGRGKINDAFAIGGVSALASTVSAVLDGLPIHYTMETGFSRFTQLIATLAPVRVENPFASNSSGVTFPSGAIDLNADNGLTFVRERYGLPNGDLDRTQRARNTLTGLMVNLAGRANSNEESLVQLVPTLFGLIRSQGFTADMAVKLIPKLKALSQASVSSTMLPVSGFDTVDGASVDIINQARAEELSAALKAADISGYVAKYRSSNAPTG